jgi:hypothetical protein
MVNHNIAFDLESKTYSFVEAVCNPNEIEFDYFLFENCQRLYDYIYSLISVILLLLSIIFYLIYNLSRRNKGSKVKFDKISTEESKINNKLGENVSISLADFR